MDAHRTPGIKIQDELDADSANEPLFTRPPHAVRHLVLDAGASRVHRAHEQAKPDELWQGDAYDPQDPDGPTVAIYLRVAGQPALVAELICGTLARALDLPAPEVYLVTVPPATLPASSHASHNRPTLCVGTRDIGGTTFAQLLTSNEQAHLPLLMRWPELSKVAAFDEWLANVDRNMGNLLYVAQTLHIIDHAEAFGGSARELFPLHELTEMAFENKLGRVMQALDASHRDKALRELQQWIAASVGGIDLADMVQGAVTEALCQPQERSELVDFIRIRLTLTHQLLCTRLGHPQLALRA